MSVDCGGVIQREIDLANEEKEKEIRERIGDGDQDFLPWCDLSVWMRDCDCEVTSPICGTASGYIPNWLNGTLIRNGPGNLTVGNHKFKHLFDGSAHLHRFEIKGGQATYQCRFLQSNTYKTNQEAQRIVLTEFGTETTPDPCQTIFKRIAATFSSIPLSDNCMISVYPFSDELYTFSEYPLIHRIDPNTLESLGPVDVSKYVNIVHHTSHPHVMEDGTVYNLGLSVTAMGPKYSLVKFPKTKKGETKPGEDVFAEACIEASLPTRWPLHPGYMHTFGMTKSFFVLVEQPFAASIPGILTSRFSNRPSSSNLQWFQEYNTLIYLISRDSGNLVGTYWADPFFYLHIINQYEDSEHVVVDICLYKDPSMIECMYIEALESAKTNPNYAKNFRGRPMRFVLPLTTSGKDEDLISLPGTKAKAWKTKDGRVCVSPEKLCDLGCETPRINYPLHLGVKYQYFYAISSDVDLRNPGTVIKVDTQSKSSKTWMEEGTFPSEPVFVRKPNAKEEDDGVLLLSLLWSGEDTNKVALVVLDGKSFTELGRVTFFTPGPVPKCLHGWFTST